MSKVKYNVWSQIEKVVDDEYEVLDMYKIVKVVDTLEEALSLQQTLQDQFYDGQPRVHIT